VAWPAVVAAAQRLRELLADVGLTAFLKTTGGKGLHLVVPLVPDVDWDGCLAASRAIAEAIVREAPSRYTTSMPKQGREKKILVDYLRNNRGSTSVAALSPRARPGAPVSMPIAWDELGPKLRPDQFTLRNALERLNRQRKDPWAGYAKAARSLRAHAAGRPQR
jgi:bifunctional non-homologous end joining protein LigD